MNRGRVSRSLAEGDAIQAGCAGYPGPDPCLDGWVDAAAFCTAAYVSVDGSANWPDALRVDPGDEWV